MRSTESAYTKLQQQIAKLEAAREKVLQAELRSLPQKYGFASTKKFIAAVEAASVSSGKRKSSRKHRTRITPALLAKVAALLKKNVPKAEIAKQCDIAKVTVGRIGKRLARANK